jgi:hypothetical protein
MDSALVFTGVTRRNGAVVLVDAIFVLRQRVSPIPWQLSGRNSAVECQLPKLDVAGSIPVARSKIKPEFCHFYPLMQNCLKRWSV